MDKHYFACFIIFAVFTCEARGDRNTFEKRWSNFMTLTAGQVFVKFTADDFKYFVMSPRNYSLIILFTDANGMCHKSKRLSTEFNVVVNSYKYSQDKNDGLFFGIVEADTTMRGWGNTKQIPEITYFAADEDLKHSMALISRSNSEDIADWIHQVTSIRIKITYPFSHGIVFNNTHVGLLIIFGVVGVLYFERVLCSMSLAVYGAVGFCQVLTAGYMWNYIKNPPLLDWTSDPPAFLHPSHMMQFLIETIIITVLYGIFAGGMILIIDGLKQNHCTVCKGLSSGRPLGSNPMTKCSMGVKLVMISFAFVVAMFIAKIHTNITV